MAETNDNPEELKLFDEQQQDPVLKEISYILKNCNRYKNHKYLAVYELKDGIVYRKPCEKYQKARLFVPQQLREEILNRHHNSDLAGHVGRDRVYGCISERYYWPSMSDDVRRWVKACIPCAKRKPHQPLVNGELIGLGFG
jgi:hypothetical protein